MSETRFQQTQEVKEITLSNGQKVKNFMVVFKDEEHYGIEMQGEDPTEPPRLMLASVEYCADIFSGMEVFELQLLGKAIQNTIEKVLEMSDGSDREKG